MAEVADGQSIINVTVRIIVRNVGEPDQAMKYIIHDDICKLFVIAIRRGKKKCKSAPEITVFRLTIRSNNNCIG
jgi:hypothetical protein